MRVADIHTGMKGYGLSVFFGTKIEKFEVTVVSVLHNFNPKTDVILITFHGQNLRHYNAIEGMSGSPIYLYDKAGKAKLAGAFAYGWPLQKDALAGVQPIQYMLKLPVGPFKEPPATQPSDDGQASLGTTWNLRDCVMLPGMDKPPAGYPLGAWNRFVPNTTMMDEEAGGTGLQPLATPMMVAGMSPSLVAKIAPVFRAAGLTVVQGGGGSTSRPNHHVKIQPGSVLGVPLLRGDADMSAIGTCTDVVGDHVYAFGHPFNSEGRTSLPLGGGEIQGIVANLNASFKLGSVDAIDGTLTTDRTVGIAGTLGKIPPMIPIDLTVKYTNGAVDESYHFQAAQHPKFTPLIAAAAISSAITGVRNLPPQHTVNYNFTLDFSDGRVLHIANTSADLSPADVFFEVGAPMIAASDNPFQRLNVDRITGTVLVSNKSRKADILYAIVPKSRYKRGETVTAQVVCQAFRGPQFTVPIHIAVPKDLPDGTYHLTISDWQKFLQDQQVAEPFRFTAQNLNQVFGVVRDVTSLRHDAIYVRLIRQPDGVAVGHVAMPKLPSSLREVMIGSGRSDVSQFVSSAVRTFKTDWVMNGSAEFDITVSEKAGADLGSAMPSRISGHPAARPAGMVMPPGGGDGGPASP